MRKWQEHLLVEITKEKKKLCYGETGSTCMDTKYDHPTHVVPSSAL